MGDSTKPSPKAESVDEDTIVVKQETPPSADRDLEMSLLRTGSIKDERVVSASNSPSLLPSKLKSSRSSSSTSVKSQATSESSVDKKDVKDKFDGAVTAKMEPGHLLKLARSASQKVISRVATLFDDLADATMEAKSAFSVIDACTYSNKFLGYTEHAMECDCSEEWGKRRSLRQVNSTLKGRLTDSLVQIQLQGGITHVEMIPTVSIGLRKWSVSGIAGAAPGARTNASSNNNTPKCP
jgi:hypothetical protein